MELLNAIQDDVLRQMHEEAVNLFSRVADLRHFVVAKRPAADVCVTLKMFCVYAERLSGSNATRVTLADATERAEFNSSAGFLNSVGRHQLVQVTICDDKIPGTRGKSNILFRPGAMYLIHRVEYVGIYDDLAKGSVQLESNNYEQVCEIAPPREACEVLDELSSMHC
ncbi:hypothetical protein PF002_g25978 [Phytophthora fragariae]|uniref:Uncharacterized protein n=1 Tax=Phytophthora fragariae TaxID=53985 RepID=A0A6A3WJD7_9STRA|nr:hypothetical protein PF003_g38781 [Phytophthora fragariae]KAE8884546.1 hypothetical protein PF003_g31234 [Phytophthora fragariae]KAE9186086.1 hypothetical protein PF002_g25978 [Phytophthora fragariae]